jgi:membrane protein YdbS with pleckstrin-like domain
MIPLNTRQGLPPNAFWYVALRSLIVAAFLVACGRLFQMGGGKCSGLLCGSHGEASFVLYLFAVYLVVSAVLRFRFFWFALTDKSISIHSGIFVQKSSTIRFDRIQDVDTSRGPLHMLLGLTSVAIWTASLDQRAGKLNRPDGLIVLDETTAEWLREHLSDPAAAAASAADSSLQTVASAPRGLAILMVAALPVVGLIGFWRMTSTSSSPDATVPASAAPTAVIAAPRPHAARSANGAPSAASGAALPNVSVAGQGTQYGLSCAIRKSLEGVKPCGELKQAGRCEHEADFRSRPTDEPAVLTVVNRSDETVKFYWLDRTGARALYATLSPGGHVNQPSHVGAHWLVSTQDDRCIGIFSAETMAVGIF